MSKVLIIMGSDSDWPTMKRAALQLKEFGIECEPLVQSAHRTPKKVQETAQTAAAKGFNVIIAAAGGAAHLAGVVASFTHIPVIGVPMETSALGGLDSLYSMVQMPRGVPVATVGIGEAGAANAALLAAQIIALQDSSIYTKLDAYKARLADEYKVKASRVKEKLAAR
ncbi:MAG: 5-(carboxyamino)imidazole ribonucleotide mutase [Planctomycetota bacterium]|nr:5-(carboxyamino)imidazole ribonucleotide mutase [Planctomycetota bacterium]MDA1138707.1 5-(carboxyamino)imidazole ribonucleotide mutase [Planctomycetota bacterium]